MISRQFLSTGQERNIWIPVRRICALKIFGLKDQEFANCENMPELEFNDFLANFGTTSTTVNEEFP